MYPVWTCLEELTVCSVSLEAIGNDRSVLGNVGMGRDLGRLRTLVRTQRYLCSRGTKEMGNATLNNGDGPTMHFRNQKRHRPFLMCQAQVQWDRVRSF